MKELEKIKTGHLANSLNLSKDSQHTNFISLTNHVQD